MSATSATLPAEPSMEEALKKLLIYDWDSGMTCCIAWSVDLARIELVPSMSFALAIMYVTDLFCQFFVGFQLIIQKSVCGVPSFNAWCWCLSRDLV